MVYLLRPQHDLLLQYARFTLVVVPNNSQLVNAKAFSYLSSISASAYQKFPELAKNPQDT